MKESSSVEAIGLSKYPADASANSTSEVLDLSYELRDCCSKRGGDFLNRHERWYYLPSLQAADVIPMQLRLRRKRFLREPRCLSPPLQYIPKALLNRFHGWLHPQGLQTSSVSRIANVYTLSCCT